MTLALTPLNVLLSARFPIRSGIAEQVLVSTNETNTPALRIGHTFARCRPGEIRNEDGLLTE